MNKYVSYVKSKNDILFKKVSRAGKVKLPALWNKHYEAALKPPQVWQDKPSWSKKFLRRSRSYGEKTFWERWFRLANPARLGVRFHNVCSIVKQHKLFYASYISPFFMRLPLQDQILFIKQLAVLIRAGVPLLLALHMLKKQNKSNIINTILRQVIDDIENGQGLAAALGKFKKSFGELTLHIIAIGEISGRLSDNLDHLAVSLKKNQSLRRKVVGASVYPVFIIIITLVMTAGLTVFIFPKIIPVFKSLHYPLPWSTRFLIFISDAARTHGLLMVISIILATVGFLSLLRIKKIRGWFDTILIHTPFVGRLIQTYHVTNICRTAGLLLGSGTGVAETFHITSNTTGNLLYKKELSTIEEKLIKGEAISTHLGHHAKLFPVMMSQMVAVGESTGQLSEIFLYLAAMYEEEMDDLTKNLSTAVEPLLLMGMGILVGFIAISIISPIYGITQHLTPK